MSARRGATDLSGILAIDKPGGITSHDVVNRVRRITGERRVGHAGTLDPMATGLLVVLVGPATRLSSYLTAAEKAYEARIVFGTETDTDDAEGRVTATAGVPDEIGDPFFATQTVASLVGTHQQIPPAYSAIKRGGVTAYEAARKGDALELDARTIEVTGARLLGVECLAEYAWDVEFEVSKGTYIRALARDLGRALDSAAHLGALRRTRSGAMDVAQAHALEQLESAADVRSLFVDPFAALGLPVVSVGDTLAARLATGATLADDAEGMVAVAHDGVLVGVYAGSMGMLKPLSVIPGGVTGGVQ
ncbi:MAG: tRNA pseudouridine(55) synthase TruB [Coriobacteriia bacterium]|nr:tRNA pseudouridine(55) synthase TruB [Coriobacteriia bacterium]